MGFASITYLDKSRDDNSKECLSRDSTGGTASNDVPQDTGWSWVICFSVFSITLLQFGYDQAIFVLFVDFIEEFQQPASVMTFMFTIYSLSSAVSSLVTSNILMTHFTTRQITCAFAILGSTLTFTLSRVPSVVWVFIVFGLKGTCFGAMLVSPTSLLGYYFNKRRSLATAVANTGLCAAFIVFPAFTQLLRSYFGLRGTLLIISAIELHALALGMLLRPVSSYRKCSTATKKQRNYEPSGIKDEKDKDSESLLSSFNHQNNHCSKNDQAKTLLNNIPTVILSNSSGQLARLNNSINNIKWVSQPSDHTGDDIQNNQNNIQLREAVNKSSIEGSEHSNSRDYQTNTEEISTKENFHKTHQDVNNYSKSPIPLLTNADEKFRNNGINSSDESHEMQIQERKLIEEHKTKNNTSWSSILDFSLLRIWPFRMVLVANGLGTFASYVNIYMPTAAVKAGLTRSEAVSLLTMVGALDLCSRLVLGCLADTGIVAKTKIVAICLACISVLCHLNRLYTTYTHFLVYAACVGLTCGCRHNLLNVILIDQVGVNNLARGLGMCSMLNTFLLAANHPVIGLLLDATGSFVIPFHFVGTVVLIASLIYFAEPLFQRLEKSRLANANQC